MSKDDVYGEKRREIGEILRTLCNWKKAEIVEAEYARSMCMCG